MNRILPFFAVLLVVSMSALAQASEPRRTKAPATARAALDLKAPAISKIFTPQQIDMILARAVDPELEHVEVEAPRIEDLALRDRSASAPEAAFKEVVRWLAPYPSVRAAQVNTAPDVTSPYRPVPVSLGWYHAGMLQPYSQR